MNEATGDFNSYVQPLAADGSVSGGLITIDAPLTTVLGTVSEWESGFVVLTTERPGAAATQVVRLRRFDNTNAPTGTDLLIAEAISAKLPYSIGLAGQTRIHIVLEYYTPGATFLDFDNSSGDVRGAWVRP